MEEERRKELKKQLTRLRKKLANKQSLNSNLNTPETNRNKHKQEGIDKKNKNNKKNSFVQKPPKKQGDTQSGRQNTVASREVEKKNRIISIASGKGGVGKTTFSTNLGLIMSEKGVKTLIIDADMGMANVDVMLGLKPKYNLGHVLKGKADFNDVILEGPGGLHILPGTSGTDDLINIPSPSVERLLKLCERIEDNYDMVLVDVGAGGHRDVLNFVRASDETIIVLTPEPTAVMDAYSMIKILKDNKCTERINLLINQVSSRKEGENVGLRMQKTINKFLDFEIEVIGQVPFDNKVRRAIKNQKPISLSYPNQRVASAINDVANKILDRKEEDSSSGVKKFFNKIIGMFN